MARFYEGVEEMSRFLPTDAYHRGFRLRWEEPWPWAGRDPVILTRLGAPGEELYRWSHYIPSLGEVFEVCKRLMEQSDDDYSIPLS